MSHKGQVFTKLFLVRLFQLIAPASTVDLLKKWFADSSLYCDQCDRYALTTILRALAVTLPNLSLIINVMIGIISDPHRFHWNAIDSKIALEDSLSYMDLQLQDELQILVSRLLFQLPLNYINAISGEMYESKAARNIAIAVIPPQISPRSLCKLKKNISLDYKCIHGLRKLLHSVSPNRCGVLSVADLLQKGKNHFYFRGIALVSDCIHHFPIIVFRNHMQWELHLPRSKNFNDLAAESALLCYQGGRLCLPKMPANNFLDVHLKYFAPCASLQKFLYVLSQNTGSLIIVGNDGDIKKEANRLYKLDRGYLFEPAVPLGFDSDFFAQIAKVDGALLCSKDNCYGYGFILDGKATKGRSDRGGRHNSALSYIKYFRKEYENSDCMAIVLSEDGMISIY